MSKEHRPKARVAKGFRDIGPDEIRGTRQMLATIQQVYEAYGFEPVEQPFIEYTDALGKFLPDQDRPNAGVFSFQDDDEQWLSLRYDLTAPLARYVAENSQKIPTPYRSYRQGWVFRNEKPGPGRFRQFMQFDADTVGSASPVADAEVCMMAADTMEALGLERGQYVMKFNSRKLLDGFTETFAIGEEVKLTWLRALDKLDRLGRQGVALLLGEGRKDESGDFTKGAGLDARQIEASLNFATATALDPAFVSGSKNGEEGLRDLEAMQALFMAAGYGADRIRYDSSIVRGLEYYTGPVFECELLMETKDEDGRTVRVVVLVMTKGEEGHYWRMVQQLRSNGVRAEMYAGTAGMKAQMKYADKRGAPLVVIQGGDEKLKGEVQIKDLRLGSELAGNIASREEYASQRLAQFSVPEADLVAAVKKALAQ